MKKLFILLAIFTTIVAKAQSVGINADGSAANSTAMLDVKSTTKGFLPPRMDSTQRDAIVSPATGLIIFCTDCGTGGEPQYYSGSTWTSMIKSSTVLNGTSDPDGNTGQNGDFFINTLSLQLFGPKSSGTWPTGVSLVGPQGADGMPGNEGAQGMQGDPGPQGDPGLLGPDVIDGNYHILNNSIPWTKLAVDSVTSDAIASESVTVGKLAYESVTSYAILGGSVTSAAIADGSVTEAKLLDGSVSGDKLAGRSVSSTHLQLNSVAEENLQDGSISTDKIKVPQGNSPDQGNLLTVGPFSLEWQSPLDILVDLTTDQTVSGSKSFQDNVRIGAGTSSETATPTAALEIASTIQGFLPPRMTSTQRNAISSPATGLIIFCTNCGPVGQPQFYSGTSWYNMLGEAPAAPQ